MSNSDLIFLCHAKEDIDVELREYLLNFNAHIHEVRPEWPTELDKPDIAFQDCLREAFSVNNLDDIPGAPKHELWGIRQANTGLCAPLSSNLIKADQSQISENLS